MGKDKETVEAPQPNRTYLIWEGMEMPIPQTTGPVRHGQPPKVDRTVTEFNTVPFVRSAPDANTACISVMRKTRRIAKFAVVEAEMIDFTFALGEDDPEPTPGLLGAGS